MSDQNIELIESVDESPNISDVLNRMEAFMKVVAQDSRSNAQAIEVLFNRENQTHGAKETDSKKTSSPRLDLAPAKVPKKRAREPESDVEDLVPTKIRTKKVTLRGHSKAVTDYNSPSTSQASLEDAASDNNDNESHFSDADLETLEKIIMNTDNEGEAEKGDESDSSVEFETLGAVKVSSWAPSDKVMQWFLKVADMELKEADLEDFNASYSSSSSVAEHFQPPKLPDVLWSSVKTSLTDSYRLKSILKSQTSLYSALKPLLSALESLDSSHPSVKMITSAIQLICSSNLNLNRLRRTTVAPYLKPEYKSSILSLPVTHNNLFGSDFEKTTEAVVKEHSNSTKVLANTSTSYKQFSNKSYFGSKYTNRTTENPERKPFFLSTPYNKGRGFTSRGRGRGRSSTGRPYPKRGYSDYSKRGYSDYPKRGYSDYPKRGYTE